MKSRDVVVRIIQPAEQPQPPKRASITTAFIKEERKLVRALTHGAGLTIIGSLAIFLAFGFFNIGFAVKEICFMVGIPLALGIVTSYAIF